MSHCPILACLHFPINIFSYSIHVSMVNIYMLLIAKGRYDAGGGLLKAAMWRHCEEQACLFLGYDVDIML